MAFKGVNFPTGFFDMDAINTPSSLTSQRDSDHIQPPITQYTKSQSTAAPAATIPRTQLATGQDQPVLSPLFIPSPFSSNIASPLTFGTPDSGYQSAFTPASNNHFSFPTNTPASPLAQRRASAYSAYPAHLPGLQDLSDGKDSKDEEDESSPMNGATHLLCLYQASHVNVQVGRNNCWEMQYNRCNIWVKTSIPQRTPLSSSGQFAGLESHQTSTKFGRSSSCPPPEESIPHPPSPLPPAIPAPNLATGHACPGILINWNIEAGSAGKGATGSHTEFFRIEVDSEENTRGFSKECTRSTSSGLPCSNCAEIPARILELKDLATNMKPGFIRTILTQLVTDKDSELRKLRTKCSNLVRQLGNCIKKLTDWRCLAFAVADSDYSCLTQLLSAGLRNGAGPQRLINLLGDVVSGVVKYNPRPSTDSRTVDITLMAYILGGRKLLYALSHGCGLPSLRTLRRHAAFTHIMPMISTISISDILHNIEEVVFKPRRRYLLATHPGR
ncbi:hypothetical protein B0H14DRAFT_2636447 [Mycena olivaceomarginata]|nr:hypothetical protein B0H14DRAFT_2636447 [Mycena olivaceomarginata]